MSVGPPIPDEEPGRCAHCGRGPERGFWFGFALGLVGAGAVVLLLIGGSIP